MSFNTSLSGLNAASKDLSVISNNVANANSTGFKKSRAQFGDIYAVSAFGNSKTSTGQGVLTESVSQQFSQGNIQFTDNSLDLAISGQGFFAFQPALDSSQTVFSRAGALGVNKDGFIVNSSGQYLRALPVSSNGTLQSTSLATAKPLQLPVAAGAPQATQNVSLSFNLPASAKAPSNPFDPTASSPDPSTYNQANSVQVYDSLGNSHTLTSYYVKTGTPNEWRVYQQVDNLPVNTNTSPDPYQTLQFNSAGSLVSKTPDPYNIKIPAANLGTGASDLSINVGVSNDSTQYNAPFNMAQQTQDGNTTGQLTGISVGTDGLVRASYTNGQSVALGMVAVANFRNPQGLKQVGDNSWSETIDSGTPLAGQAGTGTFGKIQGGALEASNVDLTHELVSMITAQRNYQANAKAIQTDKTLSDTIINIR